MRMVIREYWQKVSDEYIEGSAILHKVLPEYKLKNVVIYPQGSGAHGIGYSSLDQMQTELKRRFPHRFICLIENGIRFDLGSMWGIHSYQDVTLED